MKPLKLTMGAFGPYADLQEIDFGELGAVGLYLITGETGSGKTTIFDAISFALFGKASGTSRDDYFMLRSDFAGEKARTFVELDFLSGGGRYQIRRAIRKTGQDVSLLLPDGTAINGDRNIKPKITEIIGLDRDQFAQIVMIAQNDFLRFLQSSTDDRLKILRRIFGTEALRQFQERLKSLVKQESDSRALLLHDFSRHGVDVYRRGDIFAEWESQIRSDKGELSKMDELLVAYDKQKQELAAALAVAEDLSKKFASLSQYREAFHGHQGRAGEMGEMRTRTARGEVALYKVKPLADEAQKEARNYAAAMDGLTSAQRQKAAADAELGEAVESMEALPPLAEAQAAYAALQKEWETTARDLGQLLALQKGHKDIAGRQATLAEKKKELADIHVLLDSLPPISGCQGELDQALGELKSGEERLAALSSLQKDFHGLSQKQSELRKEQAAFETLHAQFVGAGDNFILDHAVGGL
jgi:exonuclease SbcC